MSPREDFDSFYAASSPRLLALLYLATGDLHESQQCLSDVYARAWLKWPSSRRGSAVTPEPPVDPLPAEWVRDTAVGLLTGEGWRGRLRSAISRRPGSPSAVPGPSARALATPDLLRAVPRAERIPLVLARYRYPSPEVPVAEGRPEPALATIDLVAEDLRSAAEEQPDPALATIDLVAEDLRSAAEEPVPDEGADAGQELAPEVDQVPEPEGDPAPEADEEPEAGREPVPDEESEADFVGAAVDAALETIDEAYWRTQVPMPADVRDHAQHLLRYRRFGLGAAVAVLLLLVGSMTLATLGPAVT